MAKVVSLYGHQACATREADAQFLEAVAALVRHGKVTGIAASYRDAQGHEETFFTGYYKDPGRAVNAANRMSWLMTQAQFSQK